jgi:diguanylate cyclase (GGDEF)-like protein/PAS domain S-box-containing protein
MQMAGWEGLAVFGVAMFLFIVVGMAMLGHREPCRGESHNDYFRLMVDAAGEGIWLLDDSANILYANHRAAEMFEIATDEMVGKTLFHFVDGQERGLAESRFKSSRLGRDEHFELRLRKRDGESLWVLVASRMLVGEGGKTLGTLWVLADISDRKERERFSGHLTQRDPLTDLPNRALLFDRMVQDIGRAHRYDRHVAVLFLDLDRFKQVNDRFGHAAGDRVLLEAARRLASRVRRVDTVARFGGDEFVVVLSDLASPGEADTVARALVDLLAEPFAGEGGECPVGVSIGIAVFPKDGSSPSELLEKADAAMYLAKQAGGGCYRGWPGS